MCCNFNTNCDSQSFFFNDLMNIFQNFNDLWHNNNFFNNFFQNVWNLNEFLFVRNDWYWCLLISIDYLKNFFYMVDVSDYLFEFFHNNCLFNDFFYLSDCLIFIFNFNDFFIFFDNFFDLFNDDWDLNYLFDNLFNVFVNVDKLRDDSFNFNNFWNFNNDLFGSFYFLNFRNSNNFFNNFFRNKLSSDNLLNN